jgi:hypothetical protein
MFEKFEHTDAELARHTEPANWTGHEDITESGYLEAGHQSHRSQEWS